MIEIPYKPEREAFCPSCNSLDTEYHPTACHPYHPARFGKCHSCGLEWTFPPHARPLYRAPFGMSASALADIVAEETRKLGGVS